ncbi:hypothetical protein MKD41_09295 [Lutibacter sp. A64]|nr:hypothetical protein [Lutibacter sp. A64]UMB52536.1 hypothetical protein MKD41_09295 [Lutibacter sp. A64]
MSKIEQIFKEALFEQLIFDGIKIDFEILNLIIGELIFLPTDNDRSTTGFQNQRLYELDFWKNDFGDLENMPIKDFTNLLNKSPIHIGKERKMFDYTNSILTKKKDRLKKRSLIVI